MKPTPDKPHARSLEWELENSGKISNRCVGKFREGELASERMIKSPPDRTVYVSWILEIAVMEWFRFLEAFSPNR